MSVGGQKVKVQQHVSQARKTRANFHYHPDGVLFVTTPTHATKDDLFDIVKQNENLVTRVILKTNQHPNVCYPLNYTDGCQILVLSKQVRVNVQASNRFRYSLENDNLTITKPDQFSLKAVIYAWYRIYATPVFQERLELMCEKATFVDHVPPWAHRFTSTRWGSCNPRGKVNLNTHLIKVPLEAIDTVIMHELCHFKHRNHSTAFYDLLTEQLPNWKKHDEILRVHGMLIREEMPEQKLKLVQQRRRFGA